MRLFRKMAPARVLPVLFFSGLTLAFACVPGAGARAADIQMAQVAQGKSPVVSDVRVGLHGSMTRLVFDLSAGVPVNVFTLDKPDRVVLDLPQVGWRLPQRPLPRDVGVLARLRYGLYKPGTTRIVLDVGGPVAVKKAFMLAPSGAAPYRFVLDLAATSRAAFGQGVGQSGTVRGTVTGAPAAASSMPSASAVSPASSAVAVARPVAALVPPRKPKQRIIAIDAGHGGADPGTQGPSGTLEKYITLAAARALKAELERSGRYRVVLTRERDVFIRLRDRIARARDGGAELFVSLHADAIKNKRLRGASVYTLSETASDAEAAALAEKENKADLIAGVDLTGESAEVTNILIDLAQRETMNQSARFAALLVKDLGREMRLVRNSHRFAGFAVLKAPDVPSILLEMGFLSNARDEKALKSKAYRAKLARAVGRAIDGYFTQIEEARRN